MSKTFDYFYNFDINYVKDIYKLTKGEFEDIKNIKPYSRIELLISAKKDKDNLVPYAQTGALSRPQKRNLGKNFENEGGLKQIIHNKKYLNDELKNYLKLVKRIGLLKKPKIKDLPYGSFYINIKFQLKTPFISIDDIPFYIIDNPIKKDKVFKLPFMSASSWKGILRWVMTKIFLIDNVTKLNDKSFADMRFKLSLLFGVEKGLNEDLSLFNYLNKLKPQSEKIFRDKLKDRIKTKDLNFRGRLRFYPSFFNQIDMMIMNPHDRKTKTGKNPIYFECVPPGTSGDFTILYIPTDLIGWEKREVQKNVLNDLSIVCKGIRKMLFKYGFSAKKSVGFGISKIIEKPELLINLDNFKKA
ncbi:MAG: RAMP superfamily CRISPR-associated protein [Promethearchaeia archaeon]